MSTVKRIWNLGWRITVCAVLLLWIFHAIFLNEGRMAWQGQSPPWSSLDRFAQWRIGWSYGPRELWRTLRLVEPGAFALSLGFMGSTILLGALRWRMVLAVHGLNLPLARTLEISMVAQFFNAFLLGSTGGDLLKAYYAARETHHKKTEAVVTVLVDRLIGLFSMLLFACVMMIPARHLLKAEERMEALAGVVLLMLGGCSVVVLLSFWGGVSRGWPKARYWLRRLPKGDLLERSLDACHQFGKEPAFLLRSLVLSTLINVLCVAQISMLVRGLGLEIRPAVLFMIVPMIISISALPITPSGLGVRENLFVLLLTVPQIHIDATKALSLSLLAYAGFLIWSVAGGVVYLGLRESQHLDEVARVKAIPEGD